MKPAPIDPGVLAALEAALPSQTCPRCHAVGTLTIREAYDPTRPEPRDAALKLEHGEHGRPLWAWCGACDAHGRVAKVSKAGRGR